MQSNMQYKRGECCCLRRQAPPELRDPLCPHCPYYAPRDYPLDLRPLWLHARSYSCQVRGRLAPSPAAPLFCCPSFLWG